MDDGSGGGCVWTEIKEIDNYECHNDIFDVNQFYPLRVRGEFHSYGEEEKEELENSKLSSLNSWFHVTLELFIGMICIVVEELIDG